MTRMQHSPWKRPATLAAAALLAAAAHADINGFGDFTQFQINQADGASGPTISPNTIRLTNQAANESRSIFHLTRQDVTQFDASFTYLAAGNPTSQFGACFVLQNSNSGPATVAAPNVSGIPTRFGYSDFFGTFNRSVAISLEFASLAPGSSSTARYQNAGVGGGSNNTAPVNLFSAHPIDVNVSYNGTLLSVRQFDTVTQQQFEIAYFVDIPAIVNSDLAYIGFTASTNANTATDQYFSNLQYHGIPEPATLATLLALVAASLRRR
jgi:hypothetical protein